MRAITWTEEFDLNKWLEITSEEISTLNFDVSDETIIKCVGLILGIQPTTSDLLRLRHRLPIELADASKRPFRDLAALRNF